LPVAQFMPDFARVPFPLEAIPLSAASVNCPDSPAGGSIALGCR
jgi:hypothetical protein